MRYNCFKLVFAIFIFIVPGVFACGGSGGNNDPTTPEWIRGVWKLTKADVYVLDDLYYYTIFTKTGFEYVYEYEGLESCRGSGTLDMDLDSPMEEPSEYTMYLIYADCDKRLLGWEFESTSGFTDIGLMWSDKGRFLIRSSNLYWPYVWIYIKQS